MNKEDALLTDKPIPSMVILKRNIKYVKAEVKSFIISFILMIVNVGLSLVFPLIISKITNLLKAEGIINIQLIIGLVLAYFGIVLFNQVIAYVEAMVLQHAGQRIIYKLRLEVFEHIEEMSQNQLDKMPVGSLVTRVASYTASLSDLYINILVNLLRNILTVVGSYLIMIFISWRLSLIMLAFVVIVFVTSYIFEHISSKLFRTEREYLSDLNTFLNENLSGMKLIQIFNQEKQKQIEFSLKNNKLRKVRMNVTIAFAIYRPFLTLLYVVAIAVIFYFGIKFKLNSGEIVAFYLFLSNFFNPIQNIADQLNGLQKAFSASEKLFNLLDVRPEVHDTPDAIELSDIKGKIEFRNVWFAYNIDEWILKDVSFVIYPKQTCAFVGATGAGKTTILSLIVRNYEIQKGQILIDDIDISKIKIKSLRSNIGQMLQDVFLFSGNIRNNITLYDHSYSEDKIEETIKYVNADSFINKLENKLDEEVIERGENFSQGQRQLLSFARTVLHNPKILILDEATANIDTETEVIIQQSLEKIKNIGTMLVVAHRLSTIQHADQIVVLQQGKIVEKGNHQELLSHKGYYYKLYQLQFENK